MEKDGLVLVIGLPSTFERLSKKSWSREFAYSKKKNLSSVKENVRASRKTL